MEKIINEKVKENLKIKNLMVKLNQVTSKNIGRVIYALFLLTILESLCTSVFLIPAIKITSGTPMSAFTEMGIGPAAVKIIFFLLLFLAVTLWITFQFGFTIMLLRMTRGENANLGFIFMGFRRFNPAGKVILCFSGIAAAVSIIARFISKFIFKITGTTLSNVLSSPEAENAAGDADIQAISQEIIFQAGFFSGILIILCLIVFIHFAFVFHLHFDNPDKSVKELFTESFNMMRGNFFRLIGLALRAGGKNLLIAVVFAVITVFLPSEKPGISVLAFLLDLGYFINLYSALVKFYFAVPVLYNALTAPDAAPDSSAPLLSIEQAAEDVSKDENADSN